MHHPVRRHPTRDRIIAAEVMKLELHRTQPRVASTLRATPMAIKRAAAPELRRAA